jgi:hypothetical protein
MTAYPDSRAQALAIKANVVCCSRARRALRSHDVGGEGLAI